MTREELLQEMERVLKAEGEQAAEEFVVKHFAELPDDVKGTALLWFYTDAVSKETSGGDPLVQAQEEGIEALEALEALQEEIKEGAV